MDIFDELKGLRAKRGNWNNQFQVVGKYISQIKQDFEESHAEGEFLNEEVFDSSGTFAAYSMSSALLGMLWPSNASKSIDIAPPTDLKDPTNEEIEWYEEIVTPRLTNEMDRPEGNLALSLDEYMLDQGIFGTSGIGTFYEDGHLIYHPYGVKEMYIKEGKLGRVDCLFLCYEWEASRIVGDYGEEKVSEKVKKAYESKSGEKFKVIIKYWTEESDEFTVQSEHYEETSKTLLKRGGFKDFPIHVGRFRKLITETYGRSPAMNALPDIMELNVLREAIIVATEKLLDPPLGVLSDGMLGNGVIDTSAGAINVFDVQGNFGNTQPVFPINDVGELQAAYQRIQDLQQSIAQHFSIDRLLDFNNQTVMTARETDERSKIRDGSLSSLLTRQITEVFTPLVERSFSLMLRNDRFGYIKGDPAAQVAESLGEEVVYIPDRIAKRLQEGKDSYIVRFTTPADRIASGNELEGLMQTIQISQALAQTHPEAIKYLSISGIMSNLTRLLGNPPDIINSMEEAQELIRQEQEARQQQEMLNQVQQGAEIAKTANEANPNSA